MEYLTEAALKAMTDAAPKREWKWDRASRPGAHAPPRGEERTLAWKG